MISVYKKEFNSPQRLKSKESLYLLLDFLGVYLNRKVNEAEILYTLKGKPRFSSNSVHFSVSHSDRYFAVACSHTLRLGLDIQVPMDTAIGVINSTVTDLEKNQEPWINGSINFFDIWCIKEATTKLMGEGLGISFLDIQINFLNQTVEFKQTKNDFIWPMHFKKIPLFPSLYSYLVFESKTNEVKIHVPL